jgi:hypothetical protein
MNWYFPHIPVLLIAVLIWFTRDILRSGRVERMGIVVRRVEQPVTFWAFVVTNVLWTAGMVFVLGLWVIDLNGLRTG